MKTTHAGAKLLALAFALIAATFAAAGCDDDHDHADGDHADGGHTSPYPSCNAITSACHEVDTGEGPIHDCHDKAHDAKSDSDCAPIKDECLRICEAAKADSGTGSAEAGSGDGG